MAESKDHSGPRWQPVRVGYRQRQAGGWNLEFSGDVPTWTNALLVMDGAGLAPKPEFRVFMTRPGVTGGTDWFHVGQAWVLGQGRAVVIQLAVQVPKGEKKLVLLPPRTRARAA
ncbi:hypothetical protein GO986_17435 [Deinococcus sp. HMF7620]|uniref:Uncharacterized protein n=1 Tax=Deinococcus arboris TaxID=2682977 RepID=A0A7C9MT05_9DEIO|nr:hypothetical protein [Deinococcus arboris]MVN88524.1 hypothetical protein [Deinococcus arboris]